MKVFQWIKKLLLCVVIFGVFSAGIDYLRMISGDVPIFNIRRYNSKTHIQTFRGLFYVAERKISASENESLVDSSEMNFKVLFFDLNVPRQFKEMVFDYTISTQVKEKCTEPSELYFANKEIKVYTVCFDEIQILTDEKTESLLSYLSKDISIIDDIQNRIAYTGLYQDNSTMKFESFDDTFTNQGISMYVCNQENINDVYIGPKGMQFQEDFCTYKLDDFFFLYEVLDDTPDGLEPVKDEEGNIIPEVFYEDEIYRYEFSLPKSNYIYIVDPAVRGREEIRYPLKDILSRNIVTMEDLKSRGLQFNQIDKEKEKEELQKKAEEEEKKRLAEEKKKQ